MKIYCTFRSFSFHKLIYSHKKQQLCNGSEICKIWNCINFAKIAEICKIWKSIPSHTQTEFSLRENKKRLSIPSLKCLGPRVFWILEYLHHIPARWASLVWKSEIQNAVKSISCECHVSTQNFLDFATFPISERFRFWIFGFGLLICISKKETVHQ